MEDKDKLEIRKTYETLSEREKEVVRASVLEHKGRKAIAQVLYISVETVNTHFKNIGVKLGTKSSTQIVQYVLEGEKKVHEKIGLKQLSIQEVLSKLSNREKEVLYQVYKQGSTNVKQLASTMYLSTWTIRSHFENIFTKLDLLMPKNIAIMKVAYKIFSQIKGDTRQSVNTAILGVQKKSILTNAE